MTKNITIRDIIYSRIDFIENNNIFDKKEYMYVNKGEIEAYSEILTDIELLTIDAFVEKYLCILKKVSEKGVQNVSVEDIEQYVSDIHQNPHNNKWYKELFLPKAALKGIYVRNENLIDKIKEILVSKNLDNIPVHLVESCY